MVKVGTESQPIQFIVYNEEEGSMYVHHDFLLPSFPLCIEWMGYDPESDKPGNLCAIGCMEPIITIWDLDIQDTLEPALKLGAKANRKKNLPQYGHTDAVLDLSWNSNFTWVSCSDDEVSTYRRWVDRILNQTFIHSFLATGTFWRVVRSIRRSFYGI